MWLLHTPRDTTIYKVEGSVQTLINRLFCVQIFSPTPSSSAGFHAPFPCQPCYDLCRDKLAREVHRRCVKAEIENQLNVQ